MDGSQTPYCQHQTPRGKAIILAVILSVMTMVAGCGRRLGRQWGPNPPPGLSGRTKEAGRTGQAEEPSLRT